MRNFLHRSAVMGLVLAGLMTVLPAQAQQNRDAAFVQRLEAIERTLQDLQRTVYRGEEPPAPSGPPATRQDLGGLPPEALIQRLVSNEQRMSDIEAELRRLTAAIETAVHDVDQIKARVDKLVADVDFRLTALERATADVAAAQSSTDNTAIPGAQGVARASGQQPAAAPVQTAEAPAQDQVLPDGTPVEQYEHALSLLMISSRFDNAEQAFKMFLEQNADHPLAANAQYWLGETFYVRKNYADAAAAFIEGYTRYPEGPKAPDNLLKLGMSLAALENTDDACASFVELTTRFPAADPRLLEQAAQQRERLACP